jgi:hypothetical protein
MSSLSNIVILDLDSGTYFAADTAVLVDWTALDDEQKEIMIEGSDTDRCLLADDVGIPLVLP